MRVLLSGASGAIGSHLVPLLTAAGHAVAGITRTPGSLRNSGAGEVVADLNDRAGLLAALSGERFDAIIHQATSLKRAPKGFRDMRETNRLRWEGMSALIAAARATGASRLVMASHVSGYGLQDHGSHVRDEESSFAMLPGTQLDAVQSALLSGEQQARAFGGMALRYGIVYRARGPIPAVPSDWNGELAFIHVEDAAAATVAALERGTPGSVYNVVDDVPVSWQRLHTKRAEAFELPEPASYPSWLFRRVAPYGGELLTRTSMRVSNAKAKAELGWAPHYSGYADAIGTATDVAAHARDVLAGRAGVLRR